MPVREGRARLWFKTKQERDEYDDLVISNIELTTSDESDDNYNLMFVRSKKENFLTLNDRARSEISSINSIFSNRVNYIDKYLIGKRDHTINRNWNLHKGILGYAVGYLLLRELPVRNFYARSSLMIVALAMYFERKGTLNPLEAYIQVQQDEFTDKDIRNYTAYSDMTARILPSADNKIPEGKVWQLNQPAYMRECPQAKISEIGNMFNFTGPNSKVVAWDGTFNMPLEGLAHPLHKDAKNIDFAWWEY